MLRRSLATGCLLLCICCDCSPAQEINVLERLKTEAPGRWEAYVQFARRLQGSTESTRLDRLANDKVVDRDRTEYKQSPSGMLWLTQDLEPEPEGHCWAR